MAGGMKIPIDVNLAQVRKSFREMNKLQKKTWRIRQQQIRVEKKEEKAELKRMTKEHKVKQKFMKEESTHTKRMRDDRGRFIKREEQFTRQTRRDSAKDFRTTNDRIKKVDRQAKKGFGRRAGGMAMRGGAMAAGGLLGFAIGYGLKAAEMRKLAMQSFSPNVGLGSWKKGTSFGNTMGMKSKGKGDNLGYNIMERSGMMGGMSRSTGSTNVVPMMEAMRATGMNQGEVGGAFSAIRGGGTKFGKGAGKREFKELLAAGMASGLEKGRMPEFMSGITSIMQTQQAVAAGDVGSGGIASLAAALGQSGKSGFQGKRGMALMGKLQQGITNPGGGEAGMAFMRQAFGFGKPGGGASFYQAEKDREGGLGKNAEGFQKVMAELSSQHGDGQTAVLMLREVFGTSITQGEELIRLSEEGNLSAENLERVQEIMKETEPIEKQAARAMKEAGTTLKRIASRMDQSVGKGAATQKALDAVEDFQKKLFNLVFEWAPKVLAGFQELIALVREVIDFFKGKSKAEKAAGKVGRIREGSLRGDKFPGVLTGMLQNKLSTESDPKKREEISDTIRKRLSATGAGAMGGPESAFEGGRMRQRQTRSMVRAGRQRLISSETLINELKEAGIDMGDLTLFDQQELRREATRMGKSPIWESKDIAGMKGLRERTAANLIRGIRQRQESVKEAKISKEGGRPRAESGSSASASNQKVIIQVESLDAGTVTNPKTKNPEVVK